MKERKKERKKRWCWDFSHGVAMSIVKNRFHHPLVVLYSRTSMSHELISHPLSSFSLTFTSLSLTHTLSLSLSNTLTHTHTLIYTRTIPLSLSLIHTHLHTHTHTLIYTHFLSLSLSHSFITSTPPNISSLMRVIIILGKEKKNVNPSENKHALMMLMRIASNCLLFSISLFFHENFFKQKMNHFFYICPKLLISVKMPNYTHSTM
jgi:hypothetical protein